MLPQLRLADEISNMNKGMCRLSQRMDMLESIFNQKIKLAVENTLSVEIEKIRKEFTENLGKAKWK